MKTDMYCWLENRDRKSLPDKFDSWLDPATTAIVCIDMHAGHLAIDDPDCTCPAPRGTAKIPIHDEFHAAARALGIPVIMVQHWQRYGGIDDYHSKTLEGGANWRYLYELYLPPNPKTIEHSWEGTRWVDLMVETAPEDYYVRTKKRLSSFYPTDLEFLLRQLGTRTIVITGAYTDCCDISTAFDAANRDFRVIIPRDVVAGFSEEAENAALMIISLHVGLVVDSQPLLAEWYARAGMELPVLEHCLAPQPA